MSTIVQGKSAEDLACQYLEQQGLVLVERNFNCKVGELDLIMHDRAQDQVVFVEVRSRANSRYGSPAESVTWRKQQRLLKAAAYYLQRRRLSVSCRFDVVAITRPKNEPTPTLEWIKDAFQAM